MPTENDPLSQAATTTPRTDPMPLASALAALDPSNDDHWTSAGKPRMEVLEALTGGNLTRADVDAVAGDLTRASVADPAPAVAPTEPPPPADNAHVADGAEPFPEGTVATQPTLQDVIDDIAFLRRQFGWPTKE